MASRAEATQVVEGIPGSLPVPDVDGAWTWSLGRFRRYAFLDPTGTGVFRMNAIDGEHLTLFADVVAFVRAQPRVESSADVTVLPGFSSPGYDFDVVAMPQRAVYDYDKKEFPELSALARIVFPAFSCEFSGSESFDDAVFRVTRDLQIARLGREATPFLKVKYRNPRFGGLTAGPGRHFMPFNALTRELRQLDGVTDGFVEFETFTGDVWHVTWDGEYQLTGPASRVLGLEALLEAAHQTVYRGTAAA